MKYKDFYSELIIENSELKEKLRKLAEAGNTQRGIPESVMDKVVHIILRSGGPAEYTNLLEHIGDLSDRASRANAIENVYEKAERGIRIVKNEKSMLERMEDSYRSGAEYLVKVSTGFDKEFWKMADNKDESRFDKLDDLLLKNADRIEENIKNIKSVVSEQSKLYVQAHKQHNLPITTLGRLGKQAAIDLGEMRFDDLIVTLKKIINWLEEYRKSGYSDEKLLQGYDENRHDYIEGEEIEKEDDDVKI
jgi:copper chaperone CopZ